MCKNQMVFGSLASDTTLWYRFWQIVEQGAYTVFNQMPLLFAVGLPIMLAKKEQARCCMEALLLYLTFKLFYQSDFGLLGCILWELIWLPQQGTAV